MTMICGSCHHKMAQDERICTGCQGEPLIASRYVLRDVLGSGAVGTTYLADDQLEDQQVAIKELSVRTLNSFKVLDLFEREVSVLRSIHHPGIPRYIDHLDEPDGKHVSMFLVQEYIAGHTLDEELKHKHFDEADVLDVIRQISLILIDLHQTTPPIIHRDIKLKNIMRRPNGRLVLIDFGSVKEVIKDSDVGGSTIAGTFGFMAPEQFAGMAQPASDVYALGVTAVTLLSRQQPQALLDASNKLIWRQHVNVSPYLMQVLETMLAPDLTQRARSAQQVLDLIEGQSVPTNMTDAISAEYIHEVVQQRFHQMHPNVRIDPTMATRLYDAAEMASRMFVTESTVNFDLPFFSATSSGPIHFHTVLHQYELTGQKALVRAPQTGMVEQEKKTPIGVFVGVFLLILVIGQVLVGACFVLMF